MRETNPISVLAEGAADDIDGLAADIVASRAAGAPLGPTFYVCGTELSASGTTPMAPYPDGYVAAAEVKLVASALGFVRFARSLGWKAPSGLAGVLGLLESAASDSCPDPYCNRYEFQLLAMRAADGTAGYAERLLCEAGWDYPAMLERDEYFPVDRDLQFNRAFPESGEVPSMAVLAARDAHARLAGYVDDLVGEHDGGDAR